jgi:hypothetical protein
MPLRSAKELLGYELMTREGQAGYVYDLYFDNKVWAIRYLVVDLGELSPGRKVLISPDTLGPLEWEAEWLPVNLTLAQLAQQPDMGTVKPAGCCQALDVSEDHSWMIVRPDYIPANRQNGSRDSGSCLEKTIAKQTEPEVENANFQLRSLVEVLGYPIQATDGESGHLEDFVLDDRFWTIRHVVVETQHAYPCKQVCLIPQWIKTMGCRETKIQVNLSRQTIESCPEYFPSFYTRQSYTVRLLQLNSEQPYLTFIPTPQDAEVVYSR